MAQRGGKADRPGPAERADHQVAQAGHDLRAGPGPDLGAVLGKGHIPHIVQAVLDRPMPTDEVGEPPGLAWAWQAGHRVHDHGPPLPGAQVADLADDLDDLRSVRNSKPPTETALRVRSSMRPWTWSRCGPGRHLVPGQPLAAAQQRGLVGLDREQVACLPVTRNQRRRRGCSASAVTTARSTPVRPVAGRTRSPHQGRR